VCGQEGGSEGEQGKRRERGGGGCVPAQERERAAAGGKRRWTTTGEAPLGTADNGEATAKKESGRGERRVRKRERDSREKREKGL